ncbi:hypothetical protein D3C81_2169280 [compost metagenome]
MSVSSSRIIPIAAINETTKLIIRFIVEPPFVAAGTSAGSAGVRNVTLSSFMSDGRLRMKDCETAFTIFAALL